MSLTSNLKVPSVTLNFVKSISLNSSFFSIFDCLEVQKNKSYPDNKPEAPF